jgi:putative SOS response-associated peptidase YedK
VVAVDEFEDRAVGGYVFGRLDCHDRQPVILEPREYGEWLGESERPPVHLLRILREEEMVVDSLKAEKKEKVAEPGQRGQLDGM